MNRPALAARSQKAESTPALVDLVAFQIFLRCGGIVYETLPRPELGVHAKPPEAKPLFVGFSHEVAIFEVAVCP